MSEEIIIQNCSPTLAGIKTGSLFAADFANKRDEIESLRSWNAILRQKGLRALPIGAAKERTLVYVYRVSQLRSDLQAPDARRILSERGYNCACPERCIVNLVKRLKDEPRFPHEIGLFLGYPPGDVIGFINKEKCRLSGIWKVYGNEEATAKTFARYKKCTRVYKKLFAGGRPAERLIVSG